MDLPPYFCKTINTEKLYAFTLKVYDFSRNRKKALRGLFSCKIKKKGSESMQQLAAKHTEEKDAGASLLDIIQKKAGCLYLSDVRTPAFRTAVKKAIESIAPESRSVREWNEAAYYILRRRRHFTSQGEIKNHILKNL